MSLTERGNIEGVTSFGEKAIIYLGQVTF